MRAVKIFPKILMSTALIVVIFSLPIFANALGFTSFGGFVVNVIPCTCSANFWLYMTPFFSPAPMSGALVYQPGGTIVFAHHVIPSPGVWLLGDYVPGIQTCFIWVGLACVPVPSFGVIHQTGTSL